MLSLNLARLCHRRTGTKYRNPLNVLSNFASETFPERLNGLEQERGEQKGPFGATTGIALMPKRDAIVQDTIHLLENEDLMQFKVQYSIW